MSVVTFIKAITLVYIFHTHSQNYIQIIPYQYLFLRPGEMGKNPDINFHRKQIWIHLNTILPLVLT